MIKCKVCGNEIKENSDYYCSVMCAMRAIDMKTEELKKTWQEPTKMPIEHKIINF